MAVEHKMLNVDDVQFDPDNPRISELLATYPNPDPETIAMALQPGDSKYMELKQAIWTHEGIVNPIIVNRVGDQYTTVEGNTRLAIYKQFHNENKDNETWSHIFSIVYDGMSKQMIDAVRLQAHLVGVRNWSPYAKAKYLYILHESEHMPLSSLIDFCGGNKTEVLRNIEAYKQMEFTYRPLLPDDNFDQHKFSNFYEAEKPSIKNSLVKAGFNNKTFAEWVRDGKFEPRQELVRKLPKILATPRAREVFLEDGADKAVNYIDRPELSDELLNASLVELCAAVQEKIRDIKLTERDGIRENDESVQTLEDTLTALGNFFNNEVADS